MRDALRKVLFVLAAMTLVTGVAACGDDDGADVRELGDGGGSGSGSGSASAPASGSASGSGVSDAECAPVNTELEGDAGDEVEIALRDFAFDPGSIDVGAGVVTFVAANVGDEEHELAFLPGGGDVPLAEGGAPDEDALGDAGAFELEAFGPGQECKATFDLEPGDYTLFCLVETESGETHASLGMVGSLTVS